VGQGVGFRVLVVDDHVDCADSVAAMVSLDGYAVRTAYTGASAIRLASEFQPHAVVLDIAMPGMSGLEGAIKLRQIPGLHNVALVAYTGFARQQDRIVTKAAGFDHHVTKPVRREDLIALLNSLVAR
jgi:CheY-like chemotaxis protein